jgi:cysteine desulfurase
MSRIINFDHGAATQPLPEVVTGMLPYLGELFGNPSSLHTAGQIAKTAIEQARLQVAQLIQAQSEEIIFTASGSESNNFALKGAALARRKQGNHIIVSAIEHFSVLHAARSLEKQGYEVTQIPVDANGFVNPDQIAAAITDKTILVSVMHANHEVGTIEPITQIGALTRPKGILFHTDAIQTVGILPVNVRELNVDLLSFAAPAFYGPKGAAGLYIRKGVRINPLIEGGIQEFGRRAGTENVAAIVGMGIAAELALKNLPQRQAQVQALRDLMLREIENRIDHIYLHGPRENRLPNNLNLGFEFIEGESILLLLGMSDIIASSGSACTSKALKASHVLTALGVSHAIANGTILFTLGIDNTVADVELLLEKLPAIIARLRAMSPLYHK